VCEHHVSTLQPRPCRRTFICTCCFVVVRAPSFSCPRCRVAFGVSRSGSMLDSLVAITVPATQTAGFYTTDAKNRVAPVAVRVPAAPRCLCLVLLINTKAPCAVQVSNPGLTSGWTAAFSQTSTSVILTVTRPLSHPTHPIAASGTTKVIYGTGPSLAKAPIGSHDENKEVGVVCNPSHHPSPLCRVDSSHPRQP
jgi:hypothetical protein